MAARGSTQEWILPTDKAPPTVAELVERIDEALATARASESAVMTVGAAALDAAQQARRAADLAERASATVLSGVGRRRSSPLAAEPPSGDPMDDFSTRADMVAERLRRLQRLPLSA